MTSVAELESIEQSLSLSPWQMMKQLSLRDRLGLAAAIVRLIWSPERTGEVFKLVEPFLQDDASGTRMLSAFTDAVLSLPGVGEAYRARYLGPTPVLAELARLPGGTLGKAFADHMQGSNLSVDFYPAVEVISPLSWLELRSRQQHDIIHVLTGFATDLPGELGVQAFQVGQVSPPLAGALIGGGLLHAAIFAPKQVYPCLVAITRGFELGRSASPALAMRFEESWDRPLAEVQAELGVA